MAEKYNSNYHSKKINTQTNYFKQYKSKITQQKICENLHHQRAKKIHIINLHIYQRLKKAQQKICENLHHQRAKKIHIINLPHLLAT